MRAFLTVFVMFFVLLAPAQARNTQHFYSVQDVLNDPKLKAKLNPDVALFFGEQKHGKVKKKLGNYTTSKKTNAFGKSDLKACNWAFLSALLQLQKRAVAEGGNAVVNIVSNYNHEERSSKTEYECRAGAVMAGVALKADVVELR